MRPTIQHLSQRIRAREISPAELTRDCLARIEKLNPRLNAFITVTSDAALAAARRAEEEIFRGEYRGPLHGIPIGLKDILDTAGTLTTAASAQYKDRVPNEDAEVVRRLRAAGAVILGKQNLHEFAYGGSSMVSFFGEVRNPWDTQRVAGGSSGGSAASVASGLGYAAIGTDTAGSIRLPAAYCGVVGLKPTFNRVSARGVIPLSKSYDHVGPITNCVADAAILLQAIADASVSAQIDTGALPDLLAALQLHPAKFRVGIPRTFFFDDLDLEVAAAIEKAIQVFRDLGAEVRDDLKLEVSADRTLSSAEAYAFHKPMVEHSPELYQSATLTRIKSGENISAEDADRAAKELREIRTAIGAAFDEVDIMLTPTVPVPPPAIADLQKNPENLRPTELIMLRNTRPFNVWGIPTISIPCGFTSSGLPIGLQLAAAPWREVLLLQAAHAYEQATDWHTKTPELLRVA